ncbi:MAG: IPT/TIG domain-containing protein [Filimonas sp.]|nr:IPT/TIG domain-containing protein [Filimonas sp.]
MKKYIYLFVLLVTVSIACRKENKDGGRPPFSAKSFWPNSGNAGTIVTINGTGFGVKAADNEVMFGATPAKVVDVRDSILIVLAPESGATGALSVKVGDKKVELGTYTYQQLSLHEASPLNGPAGTNIAIKGMGFSSLNIPAEVTVNGKSALVTIVNDTLIVATVPVAAGSGKIAVKVNGKEVAGPDFLFQSIQKLKPLSGGDNTTVTITGEGFSATPAGNIVVFNGKNATVVSATNTQLVVTAPAGVATGPVSVIINGQKTTGNVFTVVPKPTIKSVTPLSGPAGATMTIKGEYFSAFTDEVTVTVNGKNTTLTSATEKQVELKIPAGTGAGKIVVTVNGQTTEGPDFKEQALSVTQLSPDNGIEGADVTITGLGFSTVPSDNTVLFNGVAATVSAATATTLKVKTPSNFSTGAVIVRTGGLEAIGPVFTKSGVVTIAGGPTKNTFSSPTGIAVDAFDNVYVADGNKILKIDPAGNISTFAGDVAAGNIDGTGTQARFSYINTLAIDKYNNLYACDQINKKIRMITPAGVVSTFAILSYSPSGLGVDKNDNVYVGMQYGSVFKLDRFGNGTAMATGYESPTNAIAVDNNGIVYYGSDYSYNSIFKVANGTRSVYTGNSGGGVYRDGTLAEAAFGMPTGVAYDAAENKLYTTDNNAIRMIADGQVKTITGWKGGMTPIYGSQDGALIDATFSSITSICVDRNGNIYVCERGNKSVRKIVLK